MTKMTVSHHNDEQRATDCGTYIITTQAWSGLTRDACGYCGVTVPAEVTHCPTCGRFIINR